MPAKQLNLTHIIGSDPVGKLFFTELRIRPIVVALFFILTSLTYVFILPVVWNFPTVFDWNNIIVIIVVYPVAGYFYFTQPHSILRVYNSAIQYLLSEDKNFDLHLNQIIKAHNRKWWIVGLLFGLLGFYFGVSYSVEHFGELWYSINWFQILFVQTVRVLGYYCIGVAASRHIITSIELNQLFEQADFPLTLDADRLEVFKQVKNFALQFVTVAAVIALGLGLQPLIAEPPILEYSIYVALYFLIAPLSFFLPIWEAHLRMLKIKNKILDKLHYDFQEESQRLHKKFDGDKNSISYLKEAETLEQLEKTIATVSKTTDWPFQGTTLYRLVVTIISPFVFIIIELFVNLISNLIMAN